MSAKRLLITGSGAICSAGKSPAEIWREVSAGRDAIASVRQWKSVHWPQPRAGEVADFEPASLVPQRKAHKYLSRGDFFGLYAAARAIERAGLLVFRDSLDAAARRRFNDATGVFVGSGGATFAASYDFFPALAGTGDDLKAFGGAVETGVDPLWLLRHLPNNVLGHLGIHYGFQGPNACVTNHAASGALALVEAADALRAGTAERAIAVAHHAPIEPQAVLGFEVLGLLAADRLRPFDAQRSGTLFGEGAAALVLETVASAEERGAAAAGAYLGGGCTTEAGGLLDVRADGDGLARAIELAFSDAQVGAADVGMVVAHGAGTRLSDASEVAALRCVFGGSLPPVTTHKWAFGHLFAASAAVDVVLALQSLRAGTVPGVAALDEIDSAFADLPLRRSAQTPRADVALVLSRGFGGMNLALLVGGAGGAEQRSRPRRVHEEERQKGDE